MKYKKGQILLITVMILATVMTIILSVSFKSVTETQVTKLEEESQKALAAAESAIEEALKENNADKNITSVAIGSGNLTSITGFSGGATIESITGKTFTSSSIPIDGSFTFYLGDYNLTDKTIGSSLDHDITICFKSGTTKPAIEATLIKSDSIKKYIVDQDHDLSGRITYVLAPTLSCPPDNTNFNNSIIIPGTDIGGNSQFLLIRVFFASTRILFSRDTDLPVQGRTVSSQATSSTSTGVSKKVVLFQSYPQIPGEFFTTTF